MASNMFHECLHGSSSYDTIPDADGFQAPSRNKNWNLRKLLLGVIMLISLISGVVAISSSTSSDNTQDMRAQAAVHMKRAIGSRHELLFNNEASDALPHRPAKQMKDAPVIGIVNLPVLSSLSKFGSKYLAASYVKIVESGGAKVVPIHFDSTPAELDKIFSYVNGIVLTGGFVSLNPQQASSSKYSDTVAYLVELIRKENVEKKSYFPLWATCLGFQQTAIIMSENKKLLKSFDSQNYLANIELEPDAENSRFYSCMSDQILKYLATANNTFNNHQFGVLAEDWTKNAILDASMRMTSTSIDRNGNRFVASYEGKKLPIYAFQYHPEKSPYEWNSKFQVDHTPLAQIIAGYFGAFFASEARFNNHSFPDLATEDSYTIERTRVKDTTLVPVATDYSSIYFWA